MKKVLKSFALTGSMLAIAATAQAANTAQVTLTSPAIVKSGCEKVGSYTMTFNQGSTLTEGDWFYMDLPANTSICNTIDYFVAANISAGDETDTIQFPLGATTVPVAARPNTASLGAGGITTIQALAAGATLGPWTNNIAAGTGAPTVIGGGGVVLRVYAPANGRRVWVYVYGDNAAAAGNLQVQNVVTNNSTLTLRLLDGQAYNGQIILNNSGANTAGVAGAATFWGDVTTDQIGLNDGVAYVPAHNVPFVENTLCVNAEQMSGDLMFTSFNSLNNFMTFTGDSQLAHVAAANAITLISCSGKTDKPTTGSIKIGSQGSCLFDYESIAPLWNAAPAGYCATNSANLFVGNRMLIKGGSTFGDPGDRYDMTLTSNTAGVYFASAGATIQGFTPAQTTDTDCVGTGTAVAATFSIGNTGVTGYDAGTCAVASNKRVTNLTTGTGTTFVGAITGINTYDTLFVDMPNMVYDTTVVGNGVEANVTINLIKYPCGPNLPFARKIGTFVTTCPSTVAGGTTLLYPFLPNMDGSLTGWWGGFTIVNGSSAAGTCALTFTDAQNDSATFTTPSIAAGGQWNGGSMATLLTQLTPVVAGTSVGNANVSIAANCTFSKGAGFGMTGNGREGTGYTPYVLDANGIWQ
jgi:hypothetical protein